MSIQPKTPEAFESISADDLEAVAGGAARVAPSGSPLPPLKKDGSEGLLEDLMNRLPGTSGANGASTRGCDGS